MYNLQSFFPTLCCQHHPEALAQPHPEKLWEAPEPETIGFKEFLWLSRQPVLSLRNTCCPPQACLQASAPYSLR